MALLRNVSTTTLQKVYRHIPVPMREALESALLFDLPDRSPRLIDVSREDNILMLTSQRGTGVLGCGGTIALHARQRARINTTIVPTDRGRQRASSSDIRQACEGGEYRSLSSALGMIGVSAPIGANGASSGASDLGDDNNLTQVLTSIRPAIVYHPSLFSPADADRAVNRMLFGAIRTIQGTQRDWAPVLRGYESDWPLLANCYSNVSGVAPLKQAALNSMVPAVLNAKDVNSVVALNVYRSQTMQSGIGTAEAFQAFNVAAFIRIMRIIEMNDAHPAHS